MRWSEEDYEHFLKQQGKTATPPVGKKSKNKYSAKKTWVDGICFDSKKEAAYYSSLKLLARAESIHGFLYHGKIVCTEGSGSQERAVCYEPDFVILLPDSTYRIIDTKGFETEVFKLKQKSIREKYPYLKIAIIKDDSI